eukprot:1099215-Rhodomonas_salina.2
MRLTVSTLNPRPYTLDPRPQTQTQGPRLKPSRPRTGIACHSIVQRVCDASLSPDTAHAPIMLTNARDDEPRAQSMSGPTATGRHRPCALAGPDMERGAQSCRC